MYVFIYLFIYKSFENNTWSHDHTPNHPRLVTAIAVLHNLPILCKQPQTFQILYVVYVYIYICIYIYIYIYIYVL